MQPVSFQHHRFPPDVIRLAVWLYFRFTLSFRDVEEMLAQRGVEASYETVRCWTLKFGRAFARNLRRSRPKPTVRWHLDEMVVKIRGERMWLWPQGGCARRASGKKGPIMILRRPIARFGKQQWITLARGSTDAPRFAVERRVTHPALPCRAMGTVAAHFCWVHPEEETPARGRGVC